MLASGSPDTRFGRPLPFGRRQPADDLAERTLRYCVHGEIYNHLKVRDELVEAGLAPKWKGHSDTETLLAAIDAWGIRRALECSTGMFAFALWDKAERKRRLCVIGLGRSRSTTVASARTDRSCSVRS